MQIELSPGPGFGDGSHETTRLCLQAIGLLAPRIGAPWKMLDFGSGSGVLSIAAAKLGANVVAVEMDDAAFSHGMANTRANGVSGRVNFTKAIEDVRGPFDMIAANILREVLLASASELVSRLASGGTLLLSGLVATDVPAITARYAPLIPGHRPRMVEAGEWRALVWGSSTR